MEKIEKIFIFSNFSHKALTQYFEKKMENFWKKNAKLMPEMDLDDIFCIQKDGIEPL